jgi:hypothetical protein
MKVVVREAAAGDLDGILDWAQHARGAIIRGKTILTDWSHDVR